MRHWNFPILVIFVCLTVALAVMVVSNRHESRKLFVEQQKMEKKRDQLTQEWSRLKLEEGSLLNQVRVEKYARQVMNMRPPRQYEIKVIIE